MIQNSNSALVMGSAALVAAASLLVAENLLVGVFLPIGAPAMTVALGNLVFATVFAALFAAVAMAGRALESHAERRVIRRVGDLALYALWVPALLGVALCLGLNAWLPALIVAIPATLITRNLFADYLDPVGPILTLPVALVTVPATFFVDSIYVLRGSVRIAPFDPNAVLFSGVAGLGFTVAMVFAATRPGARFANLALVVGSLILAGLMYGNHIFAFPRLYFEAHIGIAFMEFLLGAVIVYRIMSRSALLSSRNVSVAVLVATLASFGLLQMETTWSARRAGFFPELFHLPWMVLTDRDNDHFVAEIWGGIDCDDNDPLVNPVAKDAKTDRNCDGVLLPKPTVAETSPTARAKRVIVITIDMLRPNNLSFYGATNATTPQLDAIASEAIRFDNAFSSGGMTTLSLPSILRSRIPTAIDFELVYRTTDNRYVFPEEIVDTDEINRAFLSPRSDRHTTVPGLFQEHGLPTFAALDDGPETLFEGGFGFRNGFEFFHADAPNASEKWDRTKLTDAALKHLAKHEKGFMWLHYYDPHFAPTECRQFERLPKVDCYDDAIWDVDAEIGRIIQALKASGQWDDTLLIVTSDHGEGFGENGMHHHGMDSYDEFVRIPMIVKMPGQQDGGARVARPVSLLDVGVTAVWAAALPMPNTFQGSVLTVDNNTQAPVISQALLMTASGVPYSQNSLLVEGDYRIMVDRVSGRTWTYNATTNKFGRPNAEEVLRVRKVLSGMERVDE